MSDFADASQVPAPSAQATRGRRSWWPILLLLLVATSAAAWWFYPRPRAAPQDQSAQRQGSPEGRAAGPARVPVEVAAATAGDVPVWLHGLGTVQAFNTVLIRSRVDGELIEIAFREGQMVKEGDLLARIDPRPYQAALDQASAKKKQDEATLASGRLDLARTQKLATQSFAPQQQLDQQSANVQAQGALIAADQAAIDNARTQLDYATIRAPIGGRLGLRLVDRGNIVRASDQTGIVEIAQLQPIAAILTAPETQLGDVIAAQGAGTVKVVALASDTGRELAQGELALVNNSVDRASGTVRIKAVFPNADNKLWPGLSVNTRLLVRTLKGVVSVPEDAIQRAERELFVFVVGEDDKVDRRIVKVGVFSEGHAVVTDGLKEGERVVTAGQSRLQAGTVVDPGRPGSRGGGEAGSPPPERRAEAEPARR